MTARTIHITGSQHTRLTSGNAIESGGIASGRPYCRADYLALKAATRRCCEAAGSLADISQHTRVDPALLSRYGNSINDTFVPLDVALDLDALAGQDVLLRTWAELRGFDLVAREREPNVENKLADHIPAVAKELGDVVVQLAETKIDTPAAALRIEAEIAQADHALENLARDCRAVRAGGGQ